MPREALPNAATFAGSVGARIRTLRQKTGLTVQEFCAKIDIPATTWFKWERGNIPLAQLPIVATALGVKARELIPKE